MVCIASLFAAVPLHLHAPYLHHTYSHALHFCAPAATHAFGVTHRTRCHAAFTARMVARLTRWRFTPPLHLPATPARCIPRRLTLPTLLLDSAWFSAVSPFACACAFGSPLLPHANDGTCLVCLPAFCVLRHPCRTHTAHTRCVTCTLATLRARRTATRTLGTHCAWSCFAAFTPPVHPVSICPIWLSRWRARPIHKIASMPDALPLSRFFHHLLSLYNTFTDIYDYILPTHTRRTHTHTRYTHPRTRYTPPTRCVMPFYTTQYIWRLRLLMNAFTFDWFIRLTFWSLPLCVRYGKKKKKNGKIHDDARALDVAHARCAEELSIYKRGVKQRQTRERQITYCGAANAWLA